MNPVRAASGLVHPFGEISCEEEVRVLREQYRRFYFLDVPFNERSLENETYLVVGRRGTGKSSLARHFGFQTTIKNAICVDVDEPQVYARVLSEIAKYAGDADEIAIPRVVGVWDYVIWHLLFECLKDKAPEIRHAWELLPTPHKRPSDLIRLALDLLIRKFLDDQRGQLMDTLESMLKNPVLQAAKNKVLEVTRHTPVIIAMDSLEHYPVHDQPMMRAIGALVECASKFNSACAVEGIHIKLFVTAEVFPHLAENVISNTLKYVRNPLYLHWRPKDLLRLACWRFYSYLESNGLLRERLQLDWESYKVVKAKMWDPYFGDVIPSNGSVPEDTFPHLLRHTQMRPRQLILICNEIAKRAKALGTFPTFTARCIEEAIHATQLELAREVLNAYHSTYPNVAQIVAALSGLPQMFDGKELDRVAPSTASQWTHTKYSPAAFRGLVCELGIVGRVKAFDERSKIAEADFEYAMKDRLTIQVRDKCVIHPMWYRKLNTDTSRHLIVYPVLEESEFAR